MNNRAALRHTPSTKPAPSEKLPPHSFPALFFYHSFICALSPWCAEGGSTVSQRSPPSFSHSHMPLGTALFPPKEWCNSLPIHPNPSVSVLPPLYPPTQTHTHTLPSDWPASFSFFFHFSCCWDRDRLACWVGTYNTSMGNEKPVSAADWLAVSV